MKYIVLGKNIEHRWKLDDGIISVKQNDKIEKYFTKKPEMIEEIHETAYPEILRFEGVLAYNADFTSSLIINPEFSLNISENETVSVLRTVFRADLNKTFVYTDKVMEETDNKEEIEVAFMKCIKEFNKAMIKSNSKMKEYCDLHHLSYANTDCTELFNYLFTDSDYQIKDGCMKKDDCSSLRYFNCAVDSANTIN